MLTVRRSMMLGAFLALIVVSSPLLGDSGSATGSARQGARGAIHQDAAKLVEQRLQAKIAGDQTLVYEATTGDRYFALKLKPNLVGVDSRPKDIVVVADTTASQQGASFLIERALVHQLAKSLGQADRLALIEANTTAKELTPGLVRAGDAKLAEGLAKLDKIVPMGAADLKAALAKAAAAFEHDAQRQQVVIYLGDGQSALAPFASTERLQLGKDLLSRRIQFFPVPIGPALEIVDLSALAVQTGGAVLRVDVRDRADRIVAGIRETVSEPVLHVENHTVAGAAEAYPTQLPPLRGDVPTLVAGKLAGQPAEVKVSLEGQANGRATKLEVAQKVLPAGAEAFFLMNLVKQWSGAKDQPALMQADYTLAFAANATGAAKDEFILQGRQALEFQKLELAKQLFEQARAIDPQDGEAQFGLRLVAQLDQVAAKTKKQDNQGAGQAPPGQGVPAVEDELFRRAQQRADIEAQRLRLLMDETVKQARKELSSNPDEAVRRLKLLNDEVRNDPNIGADLKKALQQNLENELRTAQLRAERHVVEQADREERLAQAKQRLDAAAALADRENRLRAAFAQYETLMAQARHAEAMLQAEAVRALAPDQVAPNLAVQLAETRNAIDQFDRLVAAKRTAFLGVLHEVDIASTGIPDDDPMKFPLPGDPYFKTKGFRTWGEMSEKRKARWGNVAFREPNNRQATEMEKKLNETTDKFRNGLDPLPLEEHLNFVGKAFNLTFIIDDKAFKASDANADIAKKEVSLRKTPNVSLRTVLNALLAQVEPPATYIVRGDHVSITTVERVFKDPSKPVRLYPVLELITMGGIGQMMSMGGFGGGMGGMGGYGGMGGMGGGGMMGMGGGMGGMMGMGGGGMMGMGGGMGGMMGMGGGMGGMMGMGGMGGMMGMGGMGGMGGMMGMGGMGGGMYGGMGGMGGGMGGGNMGMMGGNISGGYPPNMSTPISRELNAQALMTLIKDVVDNSPNSWHVSPPFMGQGSGSSDASSSSDANAPAGDRASTDVLSYYDPTFSLVIRAPSLKNTRTGGPTGGGGAEVNAMNGKKEDRQLAGKDGSKPASGGKADPKAGAGDSAVAKNGSSKPANSQPAKEIDPKQAWDLAMDKSAISPGFALAAAAFLGEAGQHQHAAEFIKSALRHGIEARAWMYDALALNLEMANGAPEEIEKALLSAADLNPAGSGGYLQAAAAMANHGKHARALDFCRQAAAQSPSSPNAYVRALSYALSAKDAGAMEWAAQNLLSRDWATNLDLHGIAAAKVEQLSALLSKEGRTQDAERLAAALGAQKVRDLVVRVTWQGEADVDLNVAEPIGTSCTYLHRQSPAGGTLQNHLSAAKKTQVYSVAQAFPGEYKLNLRRAWGRTVGGKAIVEIIKNQGTSDETVRRETVNLDQDQTLTVKLENGRRSALADVPSEACFAALAAELRPATAQAAAQLAALATPVVRGSSGYIQADVLDDNNPAFRAAKAQSAQAWQGTVTPTFSAGAGLAATATPSADGNAVRVQFTPIFLEKVSAQTKINPLIPSGK